MITQFSSTALRNILNDFYYLTGIPISIYDTNHEITYCNDILPEYCALIRQTPLGCVRCQKLNESACAAAVAQKNAVTYICHAGLHETVVPIFIEESHVGFLVFGQYLTPDESGIRQMIRVSDSLKISIEQLEKCRKTLPVIDDTKRHAVIRLISVLLDGILSKQLIKVSRADQLNSILTYISANLQNDLSAQTLCLHFHISHSELYKLFEELRQAPHQYITRLRMEKAHQLLQTGNLSIQDICTEIGYQNYTYFIRSFRDHYGISPGKFRKQCKVEENCQTDSGRI